MRTYDELISIDSYLDRFLYLKLSGVVGEETFGYKRYLNQILYNTKEWKDLRNEIIIRDGACDLAHPDYEIVYNRILIHHLEPISISDILERKSKVLDPNNLVCVTMNTHNAIHYGDESKLCRQIVERSPNDTIPWR